jgi:hypothetical protein
MRRCWRSVCSVSWWRSCPASLDLNGNQAGPERRLTNGPEHSYEASLARLGDDLVVAWYDQSDRGQRIAKLGLWARSGANRWVKAFDAGTRNPVVLSDGTAIFCAWIQMEDEGREAVVAGWWESDGRPRLGPSRLGSASKTTWNLNASLDVNGTLVTAPLVDLTGEIDGRARRITTTPGNRSGRT